MRIRRGTVLIAAVLAAAGLTACRGNGDSAGVTGPTVARSGAENRVVYDRSVDEHFSFVTPSGNLRCAIHPRDDDVRKGSLRCDVVTATWTPSSKPGDCDFDWAKVMTLEKKAAAGACVSDAVDLQGADTVRYGTGVRWHNITCFSEPVGLTCTNTDNKAGFTVSRSAYTLT